MSRFMAIHNVPGITEEQFKEKLQGVAKWRPDRRTTILKVYADIDNGKIVSECEAAEQQHFGHIGTFRISDTLAGRQLGRLRSQLGRFRG